jgi:hypothetical protein
MKKAILIDSSAREIREIEIDTWKDIAPAIGAELFDVVHLGDGKHDVFVDDEGIYRGGEVFHIKGTAFAPDMQPLIGNGLILGLDLATGDSRSATLTVEEVAEMIVFGHREAWGLA